MALQNLIKENGGKYGNLHKTLEVLLNNHYSRKFFI
jgi:hypothetical protein